MGKKKVSTEQEKGKKTAKVAGLKGGQRVKDMSSTAIIIEEPILTEVAEGAEGTKAPKVTKTPKVRGKKYQEAKQMIDKNKVYSISEALKLAKKSSYSKFGGSIEAHFNVTKKGLSGEIQLPYLKGKEKKVAIFNEEVLGKIKDNKIDFEVLLATPADMAKLVPFAKILGPKGLMPNPKNGTIMANPLVAKEKFSKPMFQFKTEESFPLIHTIIGKFDQKEEELVANFKALVAAIGPTNIQRVHLKASMGPSVKVTL